MDGWLRRWMVAAAVYNALWGLGVVVFAGPVAWKCVGMLVACYAPGYWWAARRPLPEIVAIGLLGKILGPIGFVWAAATGRLPLAFGFVILANDVVRRAYKGTCVTGSGTRLEAAEGSAARQLATAFPVVVAVSVAFLYSLGAIELVGQLREDHVDALAALPLVPLQQVLGRGIWVATHELWWMLAIASLGVVFAQRVERVESRRKRIGIQVTFGVLGVAAVFAFLPLLVMRMLLAVVAGLVVAWPFRERITQGLSFNEVIAASAVFAVLYAASGAVVTPEHLPIVRLKLESGSARGALVAVDGSSWYLSRGGKIDAIPARSVVSSRIERVGRRHYRPLWRL